MGMFDTRIDNWSLGVILYVMISGKLPFSGKNRKDTFWSKMNGVLSFSHKPFRSASTEVKELIVGLLMRNPNDRYLALEVMQHPWVCNGAASEDIKIPLEVIRSMHQYAYTSDLKKWVSYMVSLIIEEKHVIQIKQMFIKYDKNHNGFIDKEEFLHSRLRMTVVFSTFQSELGLELNEAQISDLFNGYDLNGNGMIDYSEFVASCMDSKVKEVEKYYAATFKKLDSVGSELSQGKERILGV